MDAYAALQRELAQARAEKAALAEVLRVIGASGADPKPVFEQILDSCATLFNVRNMAISLIHIVRTVFIRARGSVSANLFTFPSGTAEFQAAADPLIEIAPDFALRELYRIGFSANLGPLPMSVRMLGSAVAMLAGVRRRSA